MPTKKKAETYAQFHDNRVEHLKLIQDAITRIGGNSFKIKSSAITFVAASILSSTQNSLYALASIPVVFIFWYLDAYFLWQERRFRAIYNDVAGISDNPKEIKPFEMPIHLYKEGKFSFGDVFGSITLATLYLTVIVILLAIFLLV